jgi:hypothetical protein
LINIYLKVLERYLIQVNASQILINNEQHGKLERNDQQKLIRHLTDFIIERFGLLPSRFEKQSVARAAIEIFPYLRMKDSKDDGIVTKCNIYQTISEVTLLLF